MDEQLMLELTQHYEMWNEDNQRRLTRHNGWNSVIDAYYGYLPKDWPYISRVVDPVIHTTLIEKTARILNAKLRGRLIPREGGDEVGALLNNSLLDFQWDNANDGGSMLVKMETCDMNTRLLGSVFALIYWKYELDDEGNCVFDGNEMKPLDLRDCGIDPSASHIRDARWFQIRTWEKMEDLEAALDAKGKPVYQNLAKLKVNLAAKLGQQRSSERTTSYMPRVKQLRGLTDRTGQDLAFPVVKIVTEYRKDRWITFAPDHDLVLRDIENPYNHGKIPVVQLRYYPIQDEPLGESEVEPVLGLWRAMQATLNGYLDETILKMRPPLKIIENAARIETINYGPEAQWLVTRQDAVEEMKSNGDSLAYFQTTYQALRSAFNVAMGDLSEQTHITDPFATGKKTATEINVSVQQQNVRDQKNQNDLSEFITDMMLMWLENNKQFLFSNPDKMSYVLRIVGKDNFAKLQQAGIDNQSVRPETMQVIKDILIQHPELSDGMLEKLYEAGKLPDYPIVLNPKEKDPAKLKIKPKMQVSDIGNTADVTLVPEDLEGVYDYVPDVKSMSMGAGEQRAKVQQQIIQAALNPSVMYQLYMEGYQMKLKDVLESSFELGGYMDAESIFTQVDSQSKPPMGSNIRETMNYKDLPPDLQAQFAERAGFSPSQQQPQGMPGQPGQPQQAQQMQPQQQGAIMQGNGQQTAPAAQGIGQ